MKLAWRIRNEIESKILKLSALSSLERDEAERRAIAEVAESERARRRARPDRLAYDLFEPVPVFTNPDPGPEFWRQAAAKVLAMVMRPLTLERAPSDPPPVAAAPIAPPRATAKKARAAAGGPKATKPKPTEPTQPSRPVRLLYMSGEPRGSARNINSEFRDSPSTEAWRADERRRGFL